MICCEKHKTERLTINAVLKADPTRTLSTRRRFIAQVNKRFAQLKRRVKEGIVEDGRLLNRAFAPLTVNAPIDWASRYDPDKIPEFMDWLDEQNKQFILSKGQTGIEIVGQGERWTDTYIRSAYQKGVARARSELRKGGMDIPSFESRAFGETDPFGLGGVFNQPFHADRIRLVYTQTYEGLKGITKAIDSDISRILAEGMAQGRSPREIAKSVSGQIDEIGLNRARTLARTEVIRAHHNANINEYERAGVEGVTVKAEWTTAGFRVCPICSANEGKVFTLRQIRGLIPAHPNCLIDGQVKIYTSKGRKKIVDVKINDLVLTHKGRFRKVIQLHRTEKQTPDVVRIEFGGTQQMKLSLTDNHPVLINDEWIEAKNIKIGNKINYLADKCRRCDNYDVYYKDYCSRTCLSKDITDRQWSNPKHRKSVSKKARRQMFREYKLGIRDRDKITKKANKKCRELVKEGKFVLQMKEVREKIKQTTNTKEHRENSSKRMRENNPMKNEKIKRKAVLSLKKYLNENPEKRLNARMAKHRKSGKKTWIEQRMSLLLDKLKLDYVFQYPILRYNVDFAIPALRIVIECDGEYWHKDKKADKRRQRRIEKEGWFVLRYTGKKINECLDGIQDELLRVVGNHRGEFRFVPKKILRVRKWKVKKPRMLYNLSVEEDESYIANGFVVHNCRCVALPIVPEQRLERIRKRGKEGILKKRRIRKTRIRKTRPISPTAKGGTVPVKEDAFYPGQTMPWKEIMLPRSRAKEDMILYHLSDKKIKAFKPKETAFFGYKRSIGHVYGLKIKKGRVIQQSKTLEEFRTILREDDKLIYLGQRIYIGSPSGSKIIDRTIDFPK